MDIETNKIAPQSSVPHPDPLPLGRILLSLVVDPLSDPSSFSTIVYWPPLVTTVRCVTPKPNSVKNAKNVLVLVLVPFALAF